MEGLALSPFYYFKTDLNGKLIEKNETMNMLSPKHLLTEIFTEWKEIYPNFIYAVTQGKNFGFLKQEIGSIVYICGFEFNEMVQLSDMLKGLKLEVRDLETIIENSYDGMYLTDINGVTLKVNRAIEKITGIPKEYYLGKKVDSLIKRGILKSSVTLQVLENKKTVSMVQENYLGKETLITGNPIFNEQGEIEKVITNIRDLSDLNELQSALKKVSEQKDSYKRKLEKLKKKIDKMIVHNYKMTLLYEAAERIANVDETVLLCGETGVGKDVLARFIYNQSKRSEEGEFVRVNCGAIPEHLLESELFGYEKGAFTGALTNGKIGLFEQANKGILFLDEVGELPLSLQVKLLRVIQDKEILRIGAVKSKKVDVRIIAATHRDLKEMVATGSFREDLYYRLHVIPLFIPPLRERKEDILPLVGYFLKETNQKYGMNKTIDKSLKEFFYQYNWPGNVRELSNLIVRLALTTEDVVIRKIDLPLEYRKEQASTTLVATIMPLKEAVELAEIQLLSLAAQQCQSTYEIAEALQSSQPTIVRKLKKYNIHVHNR
jgi:PAS domain S-box-containing protein